MLAVFVSEPPLMPSSGPARLVLAAEAGVPDVLLLNMRRTLPNAFEPSMGSVPPSVTLPPLRLMSADVLVLLKLERWTCTRSNNDVIVLLVELRSGPASDRDAGETSSDAGAPVKVSATRRKLPPDCASLPITDELVSWMNAELPVDETWAPCRMLKVLQHAPADVENDAPKPSDVVLKVLFVADKSGPASVSRVGVPESDRRTETTSPAASTELCVKLRKGWLLVLLTCEPSKMLRKLKVLSVGSPVVK